MEIDLSGYRQKKVFQVNAEGAKEAKVIAFNKFVGYADDIRFKSKGRGGLIVPLLLNVKVQPAVK